ncbi:MAG: flavin reductase family protein [Nitrososphaerales archaeon]
MVELKENVSLNFALRLMYPRPTVLVSCALDGKPNIITLAWSTPLSHCPPLLGISVGLERYSHELIDKSGEFVVNIPTIDLIKQTILCGERSGREVDKFKEANLTPLPSLKVRAPSILECVAHLECKVVQRIHVGDHTLFVGEVLAARVNEGLFKRVFNPEKIQLIMHLGSRDFTTNELKLRKAA